jgi:hypothetical protein
MYPIGGSEGGFWHGMLFGPPPQIPEPGASGRGRPLRDGPYPPKKNFAHGLHECEDGMAKQHGQWHAAKAAGRTRYHGRACARCGGTLRRTFNSDCVGCRGSGARKGRVQVQAARHRARERGLTFSLGAADAGRIQAAEGRPCPACEAPMVSRTRHAPSLDRVDNEQGYTPENVELICRRCNELKRDATSAELFQLARWLRSAEAQVDFAGL